MLQDFGSMKWELVGCLALSWLLVIASLFKGIEVYLIFLGNWVKF